MEEASHDPKNLTLLPPPHNSISKTILVTFVLLILLLITGAAGYYIGSSFKNTEPESTVTTIVE